MELTPSALILVPLAAVIAPLLARLVGKILRVPLVVFEILLGLLIGPALLGWVHPDALLHTLSQFGLAVLFFLAGSEIDFAAVRGRPLRRSILGWLVSLVAGVLIGILLAPDPIAGVFVGIALTSTALGTIMPVLRDAGELKTPFGVAVLAVGAIGEFGPLLAISLFLSGRAPLQATIVLIVFAVVAGGAIWLAAAGAGKRLHGAITATLHTSGQFAVRLVLFILLALVALSVVLDIDMLLGAFAAGVLWRLVISGAPEHDVEQIESKLEAVGYGFLVPVFFIYTGITFDLPALLADPRALVLLPVFLVLLVVVRGLPSTLSAPPGATARDRAAIGLFGATGLPIIVAVTNIGVARGELGSGTAASLVGAGLLTVLVLPLVALTLRKRAGSAPDDSRPTPFIAEEG